MAEIPTPGSSLISTLTGDEVARVSPEASLVEVAAALVRDEVGALVVGEGDRPRGVVSERDITRAVAAGKDPAATTAMDVATTELVWCAADSTVEEVAAEMMDHYIRHVLVEEDGALVGMVSARDLLGVYTAEAELVED